jgi:hypothetical protein
VAKEFVSTIDEVDNHRRNSYASAPTSESR